MAHIPNGTTQADKDIAQQVIALANLNLKADLTFAADGLAGTYVLEGNHVTCTIVSVMGLKVEDYGHGRKLEPVELDLSADGETLTAHLSSEPGPKGVKKDLRMIRNTES